MNSETRPNEGSCQSVCSPSGVTQMQLPFVAARSDKVLVRLSAGDQKYRDMCVDTDKEFTWGFLMMTRAQRLKATVQCLESMLSYERNRELAEESLIMRSADWDTCQPARINWSKIECIARNEAQIRANDFAEFRRLRHTPVR